MSIETILPTHDFYNGYPKNNLNAARKGDRSTMAIFCSQRDHIIVVNMFANCKAHRQKKTAKLLLSNTLSRTIY